MENNHPRVGVGSIIVKGHSILLGYRLGKHSSNNWCPPGGHLEMMETPEDATIRETLEESGLVIKDPHLKAVTNNLFPETGKHYVTLIYVSEYIEGEPQVTEPDKCKEWKWFDWDELPTPLFPSLATAISQGFDPFS